MNNTGNKAQTLRKKLVRSLIIIVVLLVASSIMAWLVFEQAESMTKEAQKMQGETRRMTSQIRNLEDKYNFVSNSLEEFERIASLYKEKRYILDSDQLSEQIDSLRRDLRLSNLKLAFTTESIPLGEVEQRGKLVLPVTRSVTITFSAMTDSHIYQFMDQLEGSLSGIIHYNQVKMKQMRPPSVQALKSIAQGQTPGLIDAEITFTWLGIKETPKPETEQPS